MRNRPLATILWPHCVVLLLVATLLVIVINGGLDTPEPVAASVPVTSAAVPLPTPAPAVPHVMPVRCGTVEVVLSAVVQPPVVTAGAKPAVKQRTNDASGSQPRPQHRRGLFRRR
ncbi:MAG: hypothetical protein ABSG86_01185 [Thermoguttaceae bacterium]|jgi:hypothetical protein